MKKANIYESRACGIKDMIDEVHAAASEHDGDLVVIWSYMYPILEFVVDKGDTKEDMLNFCVEMIENSYDSDSGQRAKTMKSLWRDLDKVVDDKDALFVWLREFTKLTDRNNLSHIWSKDELCEKLLAHGYVKWAEGNHLSRDDAIRTGTRTEYVVGFILHHLSAESSFRLIPPDTSALIEKLAGEY